MRNQPLYGSIDEEGQDHYLGASGQTKKDDRSLASKSCGLFVLFAILTATMTGLMLSKDSMLSSSSMGFSSGSSSSGAVMKSSSSSSSSSSVSFTLYRDNYNPLPFFDPSNVVGYPFLKVYASVIEPYRTMKLKIYGADDASAYSYTVCPLADAAANGKAAKKQGLSNSKGKSKAKSSHSNKAAASSSSSSSCQSSVGGSEDSGVLFECEVHSTYSVTVTNQETSESLTGTALCIYVRREVRGLTTEDLEGFVKALYVLYSTPNEIGKAKYGEDFENSSYILRHHYFNAALHDNDHIHEGNGFLMQHLKITNFVDYSALLVDPKESLPYWDFTLDAATQGLHHDRTPMLQENTFGQSPFLYETPLGFTYSDHKPEEAHIVNGLWKEIIMEKNPFASMTKGYGYIRSPWNMNPSPYVSRFMSTYANFTYPLCSSHYKALELTDLMDFFFGTETGPHGNTHILFGGVFGCDELLPFYERGYLTSLYDVGTVCVEWFAAMKYLYREGIVEPQLCDVPDSGNLNDAFCPFQCANGTDIDSIFSELRTLPGTLFTDVDGNLDHFFGEFVCGGRASRIYSGDPLQSSSTADPSFWMIHPTVERLFHAKLSTGGFDTVDWGVDPVTDYVCGNNYCYDEDTKTHGYFDKCCYGHKENDRMYNGVLGSTTDFLGDTNAETLVMSDPRYVTYSQPYIYDNFEYTHCSGYNFTALLIELREENAMGIKRAMSSHQQELRAKKAKAVQHGNEKAAADRMKKSKKIVVKPHGQWKV